MEKITLWKDREKGTVDPYLFSTIAEELARQFNQDHEGSQKKANTQRQLRKFYDEVLRLNSEAKARQREWDRIIPLVHMLTAKAAYAKGRGFISDTFLEFIKGSVSQIEEQKDLAVFANLFEAVIGFYKHHGPSK